MPNKKSSKKTTNNTPKENSNLNTQPTVTQMKNIFFYAVYDIEADIYDIPFCALSDLNAKRKFIMDINLRNNTMLNSFKDSFELHKIGSYDKKLGILNPNKNNIIIITGESVSKKEVPNENSNGS